VAAGPANAGRAGPALVRARDLGIRIGTGIPGPFNAITDVPGVRVGHTTIIRGGGPLVRGEGPVRTGVTVVVPHEGDTWARPVFAGAHSLNGNGEFTGVEWIREAGHLYGPVAITNTHSVGVVRDRLVDHAIASPAADSLPLPLPVVGETWDGRLNDIDGHHVRAEHVDAAIAAAATGPVAEGGVGGGTGMVCHEFKGGIGTASRVLEAADGGFTVGVLVQANYGRRGLLRVDGVPVGEAIGRSEVPSPADQADAVARRAPGAGSIIIVVATDAPALPHQCRRLAQRASLGLARVGGVGATSSGDIFLCFATGNDALQPAEVMPRHGPVEVVRAIVDGALDPLFEAVVEATEEAIVNALVAAETMTGRDGITAHRLPHDRLIELMRAHGRA
jgi:D-aminopeptidase